MMCDMGMMINRRRVYGGSNRFIQFADPAVKAICVATWGGATGGSTHVAGTDGEMTYEQAAAVTVLGTGFRFNTDITSFDELQYFTGITNVTNFAFQSCSNLTHVVLPENITSIGLIAFAQCKKLNNINIPLSVTNLGQGCFDGCSSLSNVIVIPNVNVIPSTAFRSARIAGIVVSDSLTSVGSEAFNSSGLVSIELPETVTYIGWGAFIYTGLKTATIRATIPPTLANTNAFPGGTIIYVPSESVEAYKSAPNWSTYADRIYAIPT